MDLEVGLPEAINMTVTDWSYVQELDYEQLPFKCRFCHGYGHFSKTCKKKIEEEVEKEKGDQRIKVQNPNSVKQGNKFSGQRLKMGTSSKCFGQNQKENGVPLKEPSSQKKIAVLSIPEE